MLESLTIRNYAIIDEMTVRFSPGLNIITGETGAGKSIVVDALELLLGARASSEMIRSGADALEVSGVFTADGVDIDGDLPVEIEDGVVIVRREVRADGNNRCFVNDRPQTLRLLKELGLRLVDFHGQHEHQSLLETPRHVEFLDGYAGLEAMRREVGERYTELSRIAARIEDIRRSMEQRHRDRELYEFQLDEIDRANIQPGEDDTIEADISRLAAAQELKALGWELFEGLSEAEGSVAERLGEFAARLESAANSDSSLQPWLEKMLELEEGVRDAADHFRGYADTVEDDPAFLAELEERLAMIERLRKKYGPSVEDVLCYRDRIKGELDAGAGSERELDELDARLVAGRKSLLAQASVLSEKRRAAAPELAREVESHLAELGMSGAQLLVAVEPCENGMSIDTSDGPVRISGQGMDRVEFMITANPGEPPRSLVKVASGGEISRVMLSLKLALTDATSVPTMVFDEIDIGVSGRIAESIGKKLRKLTERRQALVITHLPQIAAMANRHFSARKRIEQDRTLAGLVELDNDMRKREVASLLSGQNLTDAALDHARQLIDNSGS